ncbi:ribosome modulation factor [Atopomonas sediminilitoris]|uniref:ribosome modulation factor n=1 Tax=Atopomonas sediminilitoris TaxID=2919919 RepID=UPI001F4E6733|nr:hypothetical protein [Atopomonas sediminilitoris]MCJ8168131.1 hypothetical protein [Atopomonas sediminilitoris]
MAKDNTPKPVPDAPTEWSLEGLNKAYQQGYMAGMTRPEARCPYPAEVPAAAWHAGWEDGQQQRLLHARQSA